MGLSHYGNKRATADIGVILNFAKGIFNLRFLDSEVKCRDSNRFDLTAEKSGLSLIHSVKYGFLQKRNNLQFRLCCMIIGINP
jgi:hypothetical protein